MKQVWIDNQIANEFAEEVAEILGRDDFNVELYGVSFYDGTLPNDVQIVDYYSREMLAIIENGEVIDGDEIEAWLEENVYSD